VQYTRRSLKIIKHTNARSQNEIKYLKKQEKTVTLKIFNLCALVF